jgi:hypothetical protein
LKASNQGSYSVKNETAHMKKQIEEFGKIVEKVKSDNYHL